MVLCPSCLSHGHSYSDSRQLSSRHSEPAKKSVPRVGAKPTHVSRVMSQMGPSSHRHVCLEREQKMSRLCLKSREGSLIPGRRLHDSLEGTSHLPIPADSSDSKDHSQANSTQGLCHPGGPLLATSAVVPSPPGDSHGRLQVSDDARLALQGLGVHSSPGRGIPSPDRLEDLPEIKEILDKSRKPSTKSLYKYKWDNFVRFASSKDLQTSPVSLRTLLVYLRHLFDLGLSVSTLKVYASAIVAHQPSGSRSAQLFTHPTVKTFFKGLINARPPVRPPIPQWSLTLVLNVLMKHPFEPMSSCGLKFLSLKTLFLVAITSARRASELAALRSDPPYLQFYKDKVVLFPDISFLPKVVSDFHLNQPISLPTLFSDPSSDIERMLHSLDVKRALSYYISRTKDFRASPKLFLCYYGSRKGSAASAPALSRWLVSTVVLAYQLSKKDVPEGIRGHSTRSMATSTALLRGVDLPDICRAATWSKVSTFVTHYRLDLRAKKETSFGRAVLTSVLQ
uniref:Core-binding (CB) domain-containing protein n=1 Tax=Pogona vitticeps TaxID=103695 RepID=A0ABM5GNR7_9SAUR